MPQLLSLFLGALLCASNALAQTPDAAPLPHPEFGKIQRITSMPSQFVEARHVDVWLPDNFETQKANGQRFQVLYMHDGQMLFDPHATWNKQAWHVDRAVTQLMANKQLAPTLVVGIWNNGKYRHSDYFPQKFLPYLQAEFRDMLIAKALEGKPRSDAYLKFVTQELKPYIDAHYPTLTDPAHTAIMGSSMGGLISIYALSEYPNIFGSAAGLSTHWMGTFAPNMHIPLAAYNYLQQHLPDAQGHKIYQDHGTTELDANYAIYQVFVNQILRDKGYQETSTAPNFMTKVYEGTGHNELAWAQRLTEPLQFLFPNK